MTVLLPVSGTSFSIAKFQYATTSVGLMIMLPNFIFLTKGSLGRYVRSSGALDLSKQK